MDVQSLSGVISVRPDFLASVLKVNVDFPLNPSNPGLRRQRANDFATLMAKMASAEGRS
jgi:hypothetical protein